MCNEQSEWPRILHIAHCTLLIAHCSLWGNPPGGSWSQGAVNKPWRLSQSAASLTTSILPRLIDLIGVHPPSHEIIIRWIIKPAPLPLEGQLRRLPRIVRVVDGELNFLFVLSRVEQHEGVVDGDVRETHHVHDWGTVLPNLAQKVRRHLLLVTPAERENHPPVAALKVALPRAATLLLQKLLLGRAEREKVRIARNDDLLAPKLWTRISRDDAPDERPVSGPIGEGLRRVKSRVLEKLPGGSRDDKAMM